MGNGYIDNLGCAVDGIQLKKNGVWLVSSDGLDPELYVSSTRFDSTGGLKSIHAKTPAQDDLVAGTYVATVKWVRWAIANAALAVEGIKVETAKYDKGLEDIEDLQDSVSSLKTEIDTIENSIKSLNTANFVILNQLITGPVILWGGNATSNWGESE